MTNYLELNKDGQNEVVLVKFIQGTLRVDETTKEKRLKTHNGLTKFVNPMEVLVQVLEHSTRPELVGEILGFRLPKSIFNKMQLQIMRGGNNIYDPFDGNAFRIIANIVEVPSKTKSIKVRETSESHFITLEDYKTVIVENGEKLILTDEEREDYKNISLGVKLVHSLEAKLHRALNFFKNNQTIISWM